MALPLHASEGAWDLDYYLGRSFDNNSKAILALGLVTTLGVRPYDEEVRNQWKGHQRMTKSAAHLGDLLGTGIPGAAIALGQYYWDQENGVAHIKTMIGAGVYTSTLKVLGNRPRPGSRNRLSFPSGHTSSAFATASALYWSYGPWVGIPSYIVATGVAASRLSDDVHWLSDTVAGATIGIWMGYAFAQKNNLKSDLKTSSHFHIFPSVQNEAYFVNVLSQF